MSRVTLPQRQLVLQHLQANGRLSSADALTLYGVSRLAARVNELRDMGYVIESVPVVLAQPSNKRFVSYRMTELQPA